MTGVNEDSGEMDALLASEACEYLHVARQRNRLMMQAENATRTVRALPNSTTSGFETSDTPAS